MIEFYHDKETDMLKLGCTLPNLANICLNKSTNHKFYPFFEGDKNLCEKIRKDMTGGPSIVFTQKAVVDQTYFRNSSNICKTIVGIDASQLYPFSVCQEMPTGLYTRWGMTLKLIVLELKITEQETSRTWLCLSIKNGDQNVKFRVFTQPESRRKLTVFRLMVTAINVKQYLKLWVATIISAHVKKPVHRCQMKILKGEIRSEKWIS